MLKKPKYGWTVISLPGFTANASYVTDVPVDFLNGMINYYRYGSSSIFFDGEGTEFTLVINPYIVAVLIDDEYGYLKTQNIEIAQNKISQILIDDIVSFLDDWINWPPEMEFENEKYYEHRKKVLLKKVEKLKEVMV